MEPKPPDPPDPLTWKLIILLLPQYFTRSAKRLTQTNTAKKVTDNDLTNPEGASENYWQTRAETIQVTLQVIYDENGKLQKIIENLKQKIAMYKQILDEANSFVEVIKEELAINDTGIDVNDVSTADNTAADASADADALEETEIP